MKNCFPRRFPGDLPNWPGQVPVLNLKLGLPTRQGPLQPVPSISVIKQGGCSGCSKVQPRGQVNRQVCGGDEVGVKSSQVVNLQTRIRSSEGSLAQTLSSDSQLSPY